MRSNIVPPRAEFPFFGAAERSYASFTIAITIDATQQAMMTAIV
jgi:hypothetical protein